MTGGEAMYTRSLILFLLFLISCGASKEDKVESAIDLALTHLSSEKCDDALNALKNDQDLSNPIFLQVLASAYACKAGVNSVEVISDLQDFSSVKVFNEIVQKSFARTPDLDSYEFLEKSLDTIFSSTSVVSQQEREAVFGKRKGQDLGMQGLLYSVVQISKFAYYFGNTSTGQKGDGEGVNTCFLNYENVPSIIGLIVGPNSCGSPDDGHPELDLSTEKGRAYACHGMTLINNSLDILESMDFGSSEDLKVLKDISEKISALREYVVTIDPSLTRLFDIRDSKSCSELDLEEIQTFIFAIYEVGFE